jgi:hypothetical protein
MKSMKGKIKNGTNRRNKIYIQSGHINAFDSVWNLKYDRYL